MIETIVGQRPEYLLVSAIRDTIQIKRRVFVKQHEAQVIEISFFSERNYLECHTFSCLEVLRDHPEL